MSDSPSRGRHFGPAGDLDPDQTVRAPEPSRAGMDPQTAGAPGADNAPGTAPDLTVSAAAPHPASPQPVDFEEALDDGAEWPELPEVHKHRVGKDGHRTDKKPRSRKKSIARRVLIVLCVIVALLIVGAGCAFAWWRHSVEQGKKAMTEQVAQQAQAEDGVIDYNGHKYKLNENIVSVCFIGYDDSADGELKGGQSDAVMVLALDTSSGKVKIISVPRDSMVTVDAYSGESYAGQVTEQLCLQYSYGDGANRSSELTTATVSRLFYNLPISYYFTLNIRGVAALNDSIGGVTLNALQTLPNSDIVEGQDITLLGKDARTYVQYRDTQSTVYTSLERQSRQIQYVKAFAAKVLQMAKSDPTKLLDLYNEAGDFTYTNLGIDEYSYLVDTMLSHGISSFDVTSLEGEMKQGETFAEFYLDKDALRQEVIDTFYTQVE